jgi:protein-S-isoprenylcysteine O-methyltransferase Ste14
MRTLSLYIISYAILLLSSILILRVLVPRDYQKRGKLSPGITILQALLFFVYGGFPTIYLENDWPIIHGPKSIKTIGLFLIILGLAGIIFGMSHIGVMRSMGRGSPFLKTSGLYQVTRNPQALACGLYVVGFLILWPSWFALGWSLLYIPLIHMMVLSEEEHLSRVHGQSYQDFCKNTPRYFPSLNKTQERRSQ